MKKAEYSVRLIYQSALKYGAAMNSRSDSLGGDCVFVDISVKLGRALSNTIFLRPVK